MRWLCYSLIVCTLASAGCLHRGRDKSVYIRPDYNGLNRLNFQIDKYSHQPPRPRHVDHYRWMYNKGPIDHTLLPELYTHEPITSDTIMPVVAEANGAEQAVVEQDQWQWSTQTSAEAVQAPERIAQPAESGIQLLTGQQPPVARQKSPRSQWLFSPVKQK